MPPTARVSTLPTIHTTMNMTDKKSTAGHLAMAFAALGLSVAVFTGCSKQNRDQVSDKMEHATEKVKEAYHDTTAAMSNAWNDVKSYSFEKKNDFAASAKAMSAKMDAEISEMKANYSEATASASRKAAMEEFKSAEADYKQKLAALGDATADTWDSAKKNVIAAWDKMQASYHKARAD